MSVTSDPYTMDARLCDDAGMVSDERVPRGEPGTALDPELTYRRLLDNLRAVGGLPRYTGPAFQCTGSAHLAGEHFRCTNPIHITVVVNGGAGLGFGTLRLRRCAVSDLHERLTAAVNERLEVAQLAQAGPWHIGNVVDPTTPCNVHTFPGARGVADGVPWLDAEHIAANDPATVIRHCERDLRVLERHAPSGDRTATWCNVCMGELGDSLDWPCDEIRDLATAYGVEVLE